MLYHRHNSIDLPSMFEFQHGLYLAYDSLILRQWFGLMTVAIENSTNRLSAAPELMRSNRVVTYDFTCPKFGIRLNQNTNIDLGHLGTN